MSDLPARYLPATPPGAPCRWGVFDRLAGCFLPAPDADGYLYRNYPHAAEIADALNADPLGHEERRRRENVAQSAEIVLRLKTIRWANGGCQDAELRTAVQDYLQAVQASEEGLNIQ